MWRQKLRKYLHDNNVYILLRVTFTPTHAIARNVSAKKCTRVPVSWQNTIKTADNFNLDLHN